MQHPSEARLRDFSAGVLAEAALAEVSLHLDECPACCNRLSELAASGPTVAWLRRLAVQPAEGPATEPDGAPAKPPAARIASEPCQNNRAISGARMFSPGFK